MPATTAIPAQVNFDGKAPGLVSLILSAPEYQLA